MTSPLSGRSIPDAHESDLDARRRAADLDPAAASQAAAGAAALAQAQHDVVVSRRIGPMAVGTLNGAATSPADSRTLTYSDVVPRDYWDSDLRPLVVELHRGVINRDAEALGLTPQWHTARGPWAAEQRWATTGISDAGDVVTGTATVPPHHEDRPDDAHSHYLVTTTVTVIRL